MMGSDTAVWFIALCVAALFLFAIVSAVFKARAARLAGAEPSMWSMGIAVGGAIGIGVIAQRTLGFAHMNGFWEGLWFKLPPALVVVFAIYGVKGRSK